jgi:hypothetical protein
MEYQALLEVTDERRRDVEIAPIAIRCAAGFTPLFRPAGPRVVD